jgi:hypothetical protein
MPFNEKPRNFKSFDLIFIAPYHKGKRLKADNINRLTQLIIEKCHLMKHFQNNRLLYPRTQNKGAKCTNQKERQAYRKKSISI